VLPVPAHTTSFPCCSPCHFGLLCFGDTVCFGCSLDAVAEAEEEVEEEEEDEDELHRVSTPVLVILSFRRFARGALSTLFRKKPSLLPRLKAWFERVTTKRKGNTLYSSI